MYVRPSLMNENDEAERIISKAKQSKALQRSSSRDCRPLLWLSSCSLGRRAAVDGNQRVFVLCGSETLVDYQRYLAFWLASRWRRCHNISRDIFGERRVEKMKMGKPIPKKKSPFLASLSAPNTSLQREQHHGDNSSRCRPAATTAPSPSSYCTVIMLFFFFVCIENYSIGDRSSTHHLGHLYNSSRHVNRA